MIQVSLKIGISSVFVDLSFPGMLLTNMAVVLFLYQLVGREKEEVETSRYFS